MVVSLEKSQEQAELLKLANAYLQMLDHEYLRECEKHLGPKTMDSGGTNPM